MKYLYSNLTTNETTHDPNTALKWCKRGDNVKAECFGE